MVYIVQWYSLVELQLQNKFEWNCIGHEYFMYISVLVSSEYLLLVDAQFKQNSDKDIVIVCSLCFDVMCICQEPMTY